MSNKTTKRKSQDELPNPAKKQALDLDLFGKPQSS